MHIEPLVIDDRPLRPHDLDSGDCFRIIGDPDRRIYLMTNSFDPTACKVVDLVHGQVRELDKDTDLEEVHGFFKEISSK